MSGTRNNGTSGGRRRAARAAALEESVTAEAVAPSERADAGLALAGLALDRLAADLRALVGLARSAALPPAKRVDDAEKSAMRHLAAARALLGSGPPEEPEALSGAIPLPASEGEVDAAWNASEQAQPSAESSQA